MRLHFPFDQPPEGVDTLWRCEAKRYSTIIDAEREVFGITEPRLEMTWWRVSKRTPKGAWICDNTQFVLLTARKRFACNTQEEAIESFRKRRERQISILEEKLSRARKDLALLDHNPFRICA